VGELNILLNQIPKNLKDKLKRHVFLKNILLIYSHMMNLPIGEKNLKKYFENTREKIPNQVEFLVFKCLEFQLLYYFGQFELLIPMNNVHMLLDFLRKYLNRIYSDDGIEIFTEEIDFDTVELLKSKGVTLKALQNSKEREKIFEKISISNVEKESIISYFDSLPIFKIGEVHSYVQGHETIEENDLANIDIKLHLENHSDQGVVDNMLRESFNYPGQHNRVLKVPQMYVLLMEKGGKLINFQKVAFKQFKKDTCELKESITISFKARFSTNGTKKLSVKMLNDTYIGIDSNLEKEFQGKLYISQS
jgi:hypothetical protein